MKNLPPVTHRVPELNYIGGYERKDGQGTWTKEVEEDRRLQSIGFNFVRFFDSVEAA
jgi:hypothetical protein